jgi:hypothetical protein
MHSAFLVYPKLTAHHTDFDLKSTKPARGGTSHIVEGGAVSCSFQPETPHSNYGGDGLDEPDEPDEPDERASALRTPRGRGIVVG